MSDGSFALLMIGIVTLVSCGLLAAHFVIRCNYLRLPSYRFVRSLDELAQDPSDPKKIRRDAKRWLILPFCSALTGTLIAIYGDWKTSVDSQGLNAALVLVVVYSALTLVSLAILIPACRFTGDK